MSTSADIVAWAQAHLRKVKLSGIWVSACCPIHEDSSPSLRINTETGGANCRAGCEIAPGTIWQLAKLAKLQPPPDVNPRRSSDKITIYIYRDEDGRPYRCCRRVDRVNGEKDCYPGAPDGRGGWNCKSGASSSLRRLLYRLDEIHRHQEDPVFFCEGEKTADYLAGLGLAATTLPGGTSAPIDSEELRILAGRAVYICPDNDDAGRLFARKLIGKLPHSTVKVLEFPGVPHKGDAFDWGRSRGELDALLPGAPDAATWMDAFTPAQGPVPNVDEKPKRKWEPLEPPITIVDGLLQLADSIKSGKRTEGIVTTGMPDVDRVTCGLRPQNLIILGARPSMGKSAFSLQISSGVAKSYGSVLNVSLEMSNEEVVMRAAAQLEQENLKKCGEDPEIALRAIKKARDMRLWLYDRPSSLEQLRILVDWFHDVHSDFSLLVVDYLGLVMNLGAHNLNNEAAKTSSGLLRIAKDHRIPLVALHQLSRKVEDRPNKRPVISDLRDSGQIEQDANMIMFLYRDEYYNPKPDNAGLAELCVAKNRNGPTGSVEMGWRAETVTFFPLEKQSPTAERRYQRPHPAEESPPPAPLAGFEEEAWDLYGNVLDG